MCPFFNLPNWYLLLCAQCVVCISSIFATSCKVCCFFFFHVGQRFHNNMSFSLEFFMESDFKEDDARQSTRLFCMHEKCFKSKGQTLPNLFVQNFYSSLFYGIKDCHLKPLGPAWRPPDPKDRFFSGNSCLSIVIDYNLEIFINQRTFYLWFLERTFRYYNYSLFYL